MAIVSNKTIQDLKSVFVAAQRGFNTPGFTLDDQQLMAAIGNGVFDSALGRWRSLVHMMLLTKNRPPSRVPAMGDSVTYRRRLPFNYADPGADNHLAPADAVVHTVTLNDLDPDTMHTLEAVVEARDVPIEMEEAVIALVEMGVRHLKLRTDVIREPTWRRNQPRLNAMRVPDLPEYDFEVTWGVTGELRKEGLKVDMCDRHCPAELMRDLKLMLDLFLATKNLQGDGRG